MKKVLFGAIGILAIWLLANFGLNLDNQAEAGRQPWDWLNQAFWDQAPDTGNIIAALYGDGTPWSTPYTQYWEHWCAGIIAPNNVVTINHSNFGVLNNPSANIIYLIESGVYNISGPSNQVEPESCSAIVGMGDVTFKKTVNVDAIKIDWKSNVIIDNIKVDGGNNAGWTTDWIFLDSSSNNTINSVEVFSAARWIYLNSSDHNTLNNIKSHDNVLYGIQLGSSRYNYISNSQLYKNDWDGICIDWDNNNINNIQTYNNDHDWIVTSQSDNTTINNSQSYNNKHDWIYISETINTTINNSQSYNNKRYWIYLYSSTDIVINNSQGYNSYYWIRLNGAYWVYYWTIKTFNNWITWIYTGGSTSFSQGSTSSIFSEWELVWNDEDFSYSRFTNPINSLWNKLLSWTNRTALRWDQIRQSSEPTKYVFGKNIAKQVRPVKYNWNSLEYYWTFWLDYDTDKYIAEVSMELSPEDEAIVDYYYGPSSQFTLNWNEDNCSQWAFTVEHINTSTEFDNKVWDDNSIGHTIYVIADGIYNLNDSDVIKISDNCIAVVAKWTGVKFTATSAWTDSLIHLKWQENIIIDGIELNGYYGWNNKTQYGINLDVNGLEKSINNTLNNIKSYEHIKNGIMLGMWAEYNTIMNSQMFNNWTNGIEIYYAGNYNIINNSIAYNNAWYGVRFGNGSKFNTINNGQFFNNIIGGIFADFTTQQNIINNVHAYNNAGYGLNFKRSSGNVLNNIYAYNNNTGINMTDVSCIGNTYNDELVMFGNNTDFAGTNGTDIYLDSAAADGGLWDGGRFVGSINTWAESMSCDRATNGRSDDTSPDTRYLSGWLDCIETGVITSWDAAVAESNIDYMFGQFIGKQAMPVWYSWINIINLDTQYDDTQYIWVVNEIIWTDPGMISITMVSASGSNEELELATIHELSVDYESSMINENFDIELTLDPTSTDWYIAVKTGGSSSWINIWTSVNNIDFNTLDEVALMIRSANGYYETITGSLYIWTTEYGSATQSFTMRTKANPTPPIVSFTNNITNGGVWEWVSNDWQASSTGVYPQEMWFAYVTGASQCNSGIAWNPITPATYFGTLVEITVLPAYSALNNQYVCIYTKDTINGQSATALSNQIRISELEFDGTNGDIEVWPIYNDIIDINFQSLYNYGYRRVNTGSECGTWLSWLTLISYNSPIVLNSDVSFNGKYLCAYGEDMTGSGRYLLSANDANISNYGNTVNFTDDVEDHRVATDTVSVFFDSSVVFDEKKYKWVDYLTDCNNTTSMVNYSGNIVISDDNLNNKYFCLYTHEHVSGIENYLLSINPVSVDITTPTSATIESPIAWEDVTFLVIETYGASDGESGLTGYEYDIAENATFLDIETNWIYYTTGTEVIPEFNENNNNSYAIRIRSVDAVWNTSARSNSVEFDYQELTDFEFEDEDNAEPGDAYTSNEITVAGLDTNETILATVIAGVLYRNDEPKGSSALVQNGDKLSIEMFASEDYDETVETELIIANRTITWEIETMDEEDEDENDFDFEDECDLSNSQMLGVASVYNSILGMYSSESQLTSFLITMQSMLEDNIDLAGGDDDACSMAYLLEQIDDELDDGSNPTNTHTTPSCKEYAVDYSEAKDGYYSPDMTVRTYFGSRDDLWKYLDSKNAGDCHVNSYDDATVYDNTDDNRQVAPNGKVYTLENNNAGYTSPEFNTVKYFAELSELRNYIDVNNPAIAVWDHDVNPDFEPVTHTAPNGKVYKIYNTDMWYMSYKFLSVKYFGTFEEIVGYIDRYNG